MVHLRKLVLILLAVVMTVSVAVNAGTEYPSPTREFFVNDFAGVLSQDTQQKIVSIGKELEEKTTAQVVFVTIDSLDGKDIESYSIDLATKWKIGQKNKDNGVLILFAQKERMLRIEVGYGLEGVLPDSKTAQIREQYIRPYTKSNEFDKGFLNGYIAIVNVVAGEYDTVINSAGQAQSSPETTSAKQGKLSRNFKFFPILIVILLVCDGIFFRFRITSMLIQILFWSSFFRGGRGGGGSWGGGSGGGSSGGGGSFGGGGSSGNV